MPWINGLNVEGSPRRIDAVIGTGPYEIQAYSPVKNYRTLSCFPSAEVRDQDLVVLLEYGFDIERVTDHGVDVQVPAERLTAARQRVDADRWLFLAQDRKGTRR